MNKTVNKWLGTATSLPPIFNGVAAYAILTLGVLVGVVWNLPTAGFFTKASVLIVVLLLGAWTGQRQARARAHTRTSDRLDDALDELASARRRIEATVQSIEARTGQDAPHLPDNEREVLNDLQDVMLEAVAVELDDTLTDIHAEQGAQWSDRWQNVAVLLHDLRFLASGAPPATVLGRDGELSRRPEAPLEDADPVVAPGTPLVLHGSGHWVITSDLDRNAADPRWPVRIVLPTNGKIVGTLPIVPPGAVPDPSADVGTWAYGGDEDAPVQTSPLDTTPPGVQDRPH